MRKSGKSSENEEKHVAISSPASPYSSPNSLPNGRKSVIKMKRKNGTNRDIGRRIMSSVRCTTEKIAIGNRSDNSLYPFLPNPTRAITDLRCRTLKLCRQVCIFHQTSLRNSVISHIFCIYGFQKVKKIRTTAGLEASKF